MLRVILMIDYSSEYDRKLLRGIMRYSKENGPWAFYRISSEPMTGDSQCREVIRMAKRWKADAIIGRWKDSELKQLECCLLYTSPSPRDAHESRMPSSA